MAKLRECDWVIEVVVENMAIKKQLFTEKIVPNLKEGAILSTNTSGLSVNEMARMPARERCGRTSWSPISSIRRATCASWRSSPAATPTRQVTAFMASFIAKRLGKGIVYAKDTPNFIANRIGVYAICNCVRHMIEMGMTVEEVDAVAGPATARPKSAAFRTADLVGIDTLQHVANNSYELLVNDEEREIFRFPISSRRWSTKGLLGNKSKQGFFKKVKGDDGSAFFYYDYTTGEYAPSQRPKFASVEAAKAIDDPGKRLQAVIAGTDKAAEFAWRNMRDTLIYTFNRIPEIADDIVNIDNAMKWGFNWEIGPFEMLDAIGVAYFVERAEKDGVQVPAGLKEVERFYTFEDGRNHYFSILDNGIPARYRRSRTISASRILKKNGGVVEKNSGASVIDLGDGVFCLEFHTKMNAIGNEILAMIHKAIKRTEEEGVGLVIANEGSMFSAGANLMLLVMAIAEGAYDEIAMTVKDFQKAMMAIKYSKIPVVAAPHNLVMGGRLRDLPPCRCHQSPMPRPTWGWWRSASGSSRPAAAPRRWRSAPSSWPRKTTPTSRPFIFKNFMNIAMAKVSMSAAELYAMGFMRHGDAITMDLDKRIFDAKQKAIALAANYRPGRPLIDLKAPGTEHCRQHQVPALEHADGRLHHRIRRVPRERHRRRHHRRRRPGRHPDHRGVPAGAGAGGLRPALRPEEDPGADTAYAEEGESRCATNTVNGEG